MGEGQDGLGCDLERKGSDGICTLLDWRRIIVSSGRRWMH
jgi:hypothetical protein